MAVQKKAEAPAPVDVPVDGRAVPFGPAEPVELPSVMGATFAERRDARLGRGRAKASAENKAV